MLEQRDTNALWKQLKRLLSLLLILGVIAIMLFAALDPTLGARADLLLIASVCRGPGSSQASSPSTTVLADTTPPPCSLTSPLWPSTITRRYDTSPAAGWQLHSRGRCH